MHYAFKYEGQGAAYDGVFAEFVPSAFLEKPLESGFWLCVTDSDIAR
jgi:hypothetical protein